MKSRVNVVTQLPKLEIHYPLPSLQAGKILKVVTEDPDGNLDALLSIIVTISIRRGEWTAVSTAEFVELIGQTEWKNLIAGIQSLVQGFSAVGYVELYRMGEEDYCAPTQTLVESLRFAHVTYVDPLP